MTKAQIKALKVALGNLELAQTQLAEIIASLQESYDQKPEKWKEGDAAEAMQSLIGTVEDAESSTQSAIDELGNIEGLSA